MLNSTEPKFQLLIKTKILTNKEVSCFKSLKCCIYHAFWHFNIYEQDKTSAQLSPVCKKFYNVKACFFFFINSFRNTINVSKSLDPDQATYFAGPDLDPNCLQMLLADNTSRQLQ